MTPDPDPDHGPAAARRQRSPRHVPSLALAGTVDVPVLRAAGWRVAGRLPLTPYADPRDAPSFVDLEELLADARVDAVALDGTQPDLVRHLPALRRAGLLVLLAGPAPLTADPLLAAAAVDPAPELLVAFRSRWEPWALTVAAALPLAGGPPLQVTVRGWPAGEGPAAELVDLVRSWCGDVVAAAAAPAPLPARVLPGGQEVGWSLLTAGGATVLVAAGGGGAPVVRLSFASARLEAGPVGVRWTGGADLPLLPVPDARAVPLPLPPGADLGLLATATALTSAVGGGDLPRGARPGPARLPDLLAAARVLEALRTSARTMVPVRTG